MVPRFCGRVSAIFFFCAVGYKLGYIKYIVRRNNQARKFFARAVPILFLRFFHSFNSLFHPLIRFRVPRVSRYFARHLPFSTLNRSKEIVPRPSYDFDLWEESIRSQASSKYLVSALFLFSPSALALQQLYFGPLSQLLLIPLRSHLPASLCRSVRAPHSPSPPRNTQIARLAHHSAVRKKSRNKQIYWIEDSKSQYRWTRPNGLQNLFRNPRP